MLNCLLFVLPYSYKFSRGQIFAHFRPQHEKCAKICMEICAQKGRARKWIRAKINFCIFCFSFITRINFGLHHFISVHLCTGYSINHSDFRNLPKRTNLYKFSREFIFAKKGKFAKFAKISPDKRDEISAKWWKFCRAKYFVQEIFVRSNFVRIRYREAHPARSLFANLLKCAHINLYRLGSKIKNVLLLTRKYGTRISVSGIKTDVIDQN